MTRKLFAFAKGKCAAESPDNPMFHEVLTSGQFFQMVLKEKLQQWLVSVQFVIDKKVKAKPNTFKLDAGACVFIVLPVIVVLTRMMINL